MTQIYVTTLAALLECIGNFEREAKTWRGPMAEKRRAELSVLLRAACDACTELRLHSAEKQALRTIFRVVEGNCSYTEFGSLMGELKTRIHEDLADRVFFCVANGQKVERFFVRAPPDGTGATGQLMFRDIREVFDPAIVAAFPEARGDLAEAANCLLFALHSAAIFHLMRVVEVGVVRMARLAGIEDPKASWGAVLKRVEGYVLRTKYEELPPDARRHIAFLRDILPRMQAIQHAWRNPLSHVESDLTVPRGRVSEETAWEIMNAVNIFMRLLAAELPASG
jgi:hypothetical protein